MSAAKEKAIRVRFAPSPTGYLHVGGARTAIFNWLFARHHKGTFALRIEDTDIERSTKQSEASLIDDLQWLGLDWDEGPDTGGDEGPYRQSQRIDDYRRRAEEWVTAGVAYPCFCSDAVLEAKKEQARKSGKPPQYDGTCRTLDAKEVVEKREAGIPEVIRFRMPERDGIVRFHDLIRGDIELATSTVGDFVLVRSNGRPTYNFAAAVDDHAMRITHVLRGEEHLPNTLRQILVYRALGAAIPEFGHLPLILAEDRSKLSKRHGGSSVEDLRSMGFLPHAVVNYLVLLGWSHPEGKELLSAEELVTDFSLDRINKSAAIYDKKKLSWVNGQYIRELPSDELFATADPYFPDDIRSSYSVDVRKEIFRLLHDSIDCLADLASVATPFRSPPEIDEEAGEVLRSPDSGVVLAALGEALRQGPHDITPADFKSIMKTVGKTTERKGKALFFPVRAALTGSVHGPDLAGVAAVRGREQVLDLIDRALSIDGS